MTKVMISMVLSLKYKTYTSRGFTRLAKPQKKRKYGFKINAINRIMLSMKYTIGFIALLSLSVYLHAGEVDKSTWVNGMSTALPTAFCNSSQYFRQCFSVSAEECEETAASATRICLKKHIKDIPEMLVQPKDGTHWGTIIGQCAGEAYDVTLTNKKIDNDQCNNVNNWQ